MAGLHWHRHSHDLALIPNWHVAVHILKWVVLQCLEPWLNNMVDPNVISRGLTDLQTWITGTLKPDVAAVSADLTTYAVGLHLAVVVALRRPCDI